MSKAAATGPKVAKEPKAAAAPKAEAKAAAKPAPKAAAAAEAKPAKAAKPAEAKPKTAAPKAEKKEAKPEAKAPKPTESSKPKSVGGVPESILKKRKTLDAQKERRLKDSKARKKSNKDLRKEAFKRAEKYVREYRSQEKSLIRSKRQAKNNNNFFIAPETKLIFATRIRGINAMDPKTRKILQLLRLRQVHNGVFVKANAASLNMLRLVEGYITYGCPSRKSVQDLIYKRGFGKVSHQRIPLSNNQIIKQELGKFGIICIEDLIHEIWTVGPHFKEVNNFLWPFKLSSPLGGYIYKGSHFAEGGDYGNREELINNLILQMN